MKCPNCGQKLENYDIYSEQYDGKYYEYYVCVCPDCGEMWEWTDVYTFSHTKVLVESNLTTIFDGR